MKINPKDITLEMLREHRPDLIEEAEVKWRADKKERIKNLTLADIYHHAPHIIAEVAESYNKGESVPEEDLEFAEQELADIQENEKKNSAKASFVKTMNG